jgi:aspartate/methionine/tyrosine aminotransferase
MLDRRDVLIVSLGGLSKSVGLPQAKLAWLALAGPEGLVDPALARLEFACDMYLGVSTAVQLAAGELLDRGRSIRTQVQARLSTNFAFLTSGLLESAGCRVLSADGGWYAVVQVPAIEPEEDMTVKLLLQHDVLTHPGYFYDFPREAYLVLSLLLPETEFREGVSRIVSYFAEAGNVPAAGGI